MVPIAHGGTVITTAATGCASCSSSNGLSFTNVVAGDTFVLAAFEGPAAANFPSFTSNHGETITSQTIDAISGNDGLSYNMRVSTFIAGSGTYSLTASYGVAAATFFVAYELRGFNSTKNFVTTASANGHEVSQTVSGIVANAFTLIVAFTTDSTSQSWSIAPGNDPGGVLVCDTCTRKAASQYVLNAPSSFHFDMEGGAGAFARADTLVFASWASNGSTTTVTTAVNNTQCVGACTGTPSGSNYIVSRRLYFAQAINGVSVSANLYNITSQINHVHVTTATAAFTLAVYSVPGGTAPSASTPFVLLFNLVFSITNSSDVGQVVTTNPNVPICGSCYYSVALFTNANASRGSGASNSGISIPTSGLAFTQYFFTVGSGSHVVPASFNSLSTTTPALYLKGLSNFALVTQTTTTTVSGTISTTTTVTSTTLDAALAAQGTAADSIILLLILFPAFALMVPIAAYTKSPPAAGIGFVAGAMIGAGAGVQAQLVPPVFLGVMLIVGIFIIVGLWKTGGP